MKNSNLSKGQIPVRLKLDEEEYVQRRAAQEDRSVSSMIRIIVRTVMQSEKQQPPQQAA
jgi:hypothetical protein